jgi:hypothetical protein
MSPIAVYANQEEMGHWMPGMELRFADLLLLGFLETRIESI